MPQRLDLLERWLERTCRLEDFRLTPASEDASFRRYFRITLSDGSTLVVMDAPPDKEDCRPFVELASRLRDAGLHVPQIHRQDLEQGFLLLEDLGSQSYLTALSATSADALYGDAIGALLRLQTRGAVGGLPVYDEAMLRREMQLFPDWLLTRHLGVQLTAPERTLLARSFDRLVASALQQPVVCVHRDYHSRNLMRLDSDNPGVIDFQDAVAGPITYDLVSLLRDCYVRWPGGQVDRWVFDYLAAARAAGLPGVDDEARFRRWFDLMGVQRHLKAAGIFARLWHRDGKRGYLDDLPRTLGYIVEVGGRRAEFEPLAALVAERVLPAL
jgi:hypothetical protein